MNHQKGNKPKSMINEKIYTLFISMRYSLGFYGHETRDFFFLIVNQLFQLYFIACAFA